MKVGDIIYKVVKNSTGEQDITNATPVTTNAEVTAVFQSLKVGDTVTLQLKRPSYHVYEGYKDVMITMKAEQFVFCDTGSYPVV
jgi:hypothetical protein